MGTSAPHRRIHAQLLAVTGEDEGGVAAHWIGVLHLLFVQHLTVELFLVKDIAVFLHAVAIGVGAQPQQADLAVELGRGYGIGRLTALRYLSHTLRLVARSTSGRDHQSYADQHQESAVYDHRDAGISAQPAIGAS